jgi:pimeloyl-ACP methyl ester carboxylesterase
LHATKDFRRYQLAAFVLIHGSWHGAWCWERIVPRLRAAGHAAFAPDLPGHGADPTPVGEVTLEGYAARVGEAIDAAQAAAPEEPVVLVGHSMGGLVITQAGEACAEKIDRLVYLTAFVPGDGETLAAMAMATGNPMLREAVAPSGDGSFSTVRPEFVGPLFYNDCSAEDVDRAKSLVGPQPNAPRMTPVRTTAARWGRLPRVYIECTDDRSLPIAFQRSQQKAHPMQRVLPLATGHSPFYADPDGLTAALIAAAG